MRLKRGDVALALFPDANLRTAKRRPVLVVQADDLGTGLTQHVVAMITSNLSRAGHPSRVRVGLNTNEGKQSGLKTDSVIMTDNLATIFDSEFDSVIGSIVDLSPVESVIRHTFGL